MQTAAQSPINRRLRRNTVHKHRQSGRASLYLAGAVPCKARQTNLQRDKGALNAALRIFLRVVQQSLVSACPGAAKADPAHLHLGAVAFIHRFGSSLNTCRIPDDCIDSKRYPLFMVRSVLKELIESLQTTRGVTPC